MCGPVLGGQVTGALHELLGSGTTAVLLGPSGAGKSTPVNRLLGDDYFATGDLDPDRLAGYLRLRAEAAAHERRASPHLTREHERRFARLVRDVKRLKRDS